MTTAQLRREIKQTVDRLPAAKLEKAAKLVGALAHDSRPLTAADRAKIAGMKRDIEQARRDVMAGRSRSWRGIRKDV